MRKTFQTSFLPSAVFNKGMMECKLSRAKRLKSIATEQIKEILGGDAQDRKEWRKKNQGRENQRPPKWY